jgi:signal transduction histidine kinase
MAFAIDVNGSTNSADTRNGVGMHAMSRCERLVATAFEAAKHTPATQPREVAITIDTMPALNELEGDLARTNRLGLMAELAASLAHEIKQPIAAVEMGAETCLRWIDREPATLPTTLPTTLGEVRRVLLRIIKDARRAASIVERNRALSSARTPRRELVDLNDVIRDMVTMLREEANYHGIAIISELEPAFLTTTADRVQLQQVLLNLMLNGIEAMHAGSGELRVTSKRTEDDQLMVAVSDCGIGFPSESSERIFEAFFTTKAQGTGMGLCISRRIIEAHGGRLWASLNTGRGATFQFMLPVRHA